jgi:Flp pilus assembly protein TadG
MPVRPRHRRRGSVLPLITISLIAVCAFVALAVDVGLMLVARTQCQAAADAAALAGARTLDGTSGGNTSAATTAAQNAAGDNRVLGKPVTAADIPATAVQHGAYHYDPTTQTFSAQFPPVSPDNYCLTRATVTHGDNTLFARVISALNFTVSATATAAHRPRDVSLVLDFSGSMNDQSDVWNRVYPDYLSPYNGTSNNTDPTVPQFGHYASASAALVCTASDVRVGTCNITQAVAGEPALVNDFYQNARGASSGTVAFTAAASPYGLTLPSAGDPPPHANYDTGSTWAATVSDILGSSSTSSDWEAGGYDWLATWSASAYHRPSAFQGYTQGPGYWGITFFLWPPDPRPASGSTPAKDWRQRFVLQTGGSYPGFGGPVTDNTTLWDSSGNWKQPAGNYVINYAAILSWIKNCPNNPFPSVLRAGNVLYYDSIPGDVPSAAYDHTQLNSAITDSNQRFWKEYIDYALGVWRDPFGNVPYNGSQSQVGYLPVCSTGPDFSWGTVQISDKPGNKSMSYTDNPPRPRHRFWFGPITMIQYMLDTGLLPGTAHDLSMLSAKLGLAGALQDIQTNHPDDLVSMVLFSRPHYQGEPAEVGRFSQAQYNLSRDYAGMINSLWFPPNSGSADVRPWDGNGLQTPRAHGDYTYNTATDYGLMLAYNQMSSSAALRSSAVGGLGRKGAQRLIVLETDGMANVSTTAGFDSSGGANNSFYDIRPGDTVTLNQQGFGIASPGNSAIAVAQRICALTTDTTNGPGFATPSKPVLIHCIAFGAIFEQDAAGSEATSAMNLLQSISSVGGTGFPSSVTATSDPNFYKLCVGTFGDRQTKLRTAFSKIMDDGVVIILVQ